MKIDLGSSVVTLTITEEDLSPMVKEYVQQRLGAGTVKVDMCLNEPCRVEFTPALQSTQAHRNMMASVKDLPPPPPFPPTTKTVGGRWIPSSNYTQQDVGQKSRMWDWWNTDVRSHDIPPLPEFPKTISTGRSGWWGRGDTGLEIGNQ